MAVLLATLGVALLAAQPAAAALDEPVSVTAQAPEAVAAGTAFPLRVDVAAEASALDVAAQPLRLRVRFAPECGGSFAGTEGPTAIDRVLPAPTPGAAYSQSVSVRAKLGAPGPETVCAFLEDAAERQFATDTEATLTVVPPCPAARRKIGKLKQRLARIDRRLRKLRRARHEADGARRRHLAKRIHKLRRQRHRVVKQLRRAFREAQIACGGGGGARASAAEANLPAGVPQIKHLFVIVLENENAETSFGPNSPAPYLGTTLREAGAFIPNYYGIGHESLDNYIAMVSGQPPNPQTQSDCQLYTEMLPGTLREDSVALGQGCVFPRGVRTVANQLEGAGLSWHGYMQDMANAVPEGEPASCRHPAIGAIDPTQKARAADQYAARHNPFVYFHSIIDFPTCQENDVDLSRLPGDLARARTTPSYSFITPDLCSDGHDETCANPALPGGFAGIEAFLREWVPRIEASAAYRDQGAIFVTFDESASGASSCCNEPAGPNTPNNGGPEYGSGGGRVGAVMLSPCIEPGTVTQTPYNHYAFLRWSEDDFGLPHLAYAGAAGLKPFGSDVFAKPGCDPEAAVAAQKAGAWTHLRVRPRKAVRGKAQHFRFLLRSNVAACRRGALVRLAGHRTRTNRRGRALIRIRPRHSGRLVATARAPSCKPAATSVRVRR
ncbi:MAG TPA: alkaline phosphatase family protein [Solirubrobacterales bacterium]|nr:alkaline phosphatase family protein [Solirubrobacterales bacterium]